MARPLQTPAEAGLSMLFRVIDFETTGMPPDAALCEIGWCDVAVTDGQPKVGVQSAVIVNPGRPMPPEARAVHHISDADCAAAPQASSILMRVMDGADAFVAHNAAFEREFFTGGDKPWICTLKAGRRLWPDSPSHSNQCLRYFLGIELDDAAAMPPHRAGPDAYVTAHILAEALRRAAPSDLIAWTAQPSLLPHVTFGKHRGKQWSELPSDYLSWIVNKSDMDADTKFTAKHHLSKANDGWD
jgi:exodeoxyribonuclease X